MTRLDSPNRRYLCQEDFEAYPIWVWDDDNDGHLPISDSKYTTEFGTLFIKAIFQTINHKFDGYLVGFKTFYNFEIFIKNKEFGFNINMNSFVNQTSQDIFKELKCEPFNLFPLRYSSPICFEDGSPISGQFVFKNGELFCIPDNLSENHSNHKPI